MVNSFNRQSHDEPFIPVHTRPSCIGPLCPEMSLSSRLTNILGFDASEQTTIPTHDGVVDPENIASGIRQTKEPATMGVTTEDVDDAEMLRPPYAHAMLAGGLGGTCGDILMHSLDTVKTRQQGDPHWPPKYQSLGDTYSKIFRQEGVRRGLYGGFTAAMLGSFPGTVIFFGTYEYCKRHLLDRGINPSLSYLASGFLADLAATVVYVPSEVLKTRLQLQGRYNNPFFNSGYNYKSTWDAARTIVRHEGFGALYSGYGATVWRDLPFSALQFAIYEQERRVAVEAMGSREIGLPLEILTGASAGGIAGAMTCPLDVVKTRIQTQITPDDHATSSQAARLEKVATSTKPTLSGGQKRLIHSGPRTVPATAATLDTSSVLVGLKMIYQTEGVAGCFRGVGPRFVWTSVQSGTMLVLYQYLLKRFDALQNTESESNL